MILATIAIIAVQAATTPTQSAPLSAPPPTAVVALADIPEPDPSEMTRSQIRDHNAKLPRDHPFYIRCVKREEIGSLIKRHYSCRTVQQWTRTEDAANAEARAIADEMASKSWETTPRESRP